MLVESRLQVVLTDTVDQNTFKYCFAKASLRKQPSLLESLLAARDVSPAARSSRGSCFPRPCKSCTFNFFGRHAKSKVICFLVSGGTFIIWDRMYGQLLLCLNFDLIMIHPWIQKRKKITIKSPRPSVDSRIVVVFDRNISGRNR